MHSKWQPHYRRYVLVSCLSASISLGGCVSTAPSQFSAAAGSLQNGDPQTAQSLVKQSGSGEDDLLYNLEEGEVSRLQTPPQMTESTSAFLRADDTVRAWEDNTRSHLAEPLGKLGSYFLSDSLRSFEGKDYEKSLLNHRLAVNHLIEGDWEAARVETRKLTERETIIKRYREKEVDALTEEAQSKSVTKTPRVEDLSGYPVEIFNDPEVKALKNSYQSAASHYLAGFIFEALGEPGLAAPGYRQAIELRPDVPFLKEGLRHLDRHPKKGKDSDVLFIVETGMLSPIESQKISVPLPLRTGPVILTAAYPVIRPSQSLFNPRSLTVDKQSVPLAMTTNIDAMSRRAVKDDMPSIILRNATRMATTAAAQIAAQQMKDKNGNTSPVGTLISLAIGIGSSWATEADTKHWTTLPAQIYMGRTKLKTGTQSLTINTPAGSRTVDVNIDGKYSVVYLRILGNDVVALASKAAPN